MDWKRCIVTGATGYLGRAVVRSLAERGGCAATYRTEPGQTLPGVSWHRLKLGENPSISALLDAVNPELIIHTAAVNPGGDSAAMWRVNRDGTSCLARAAAQRGIHLIHLSTDVLHSGLHPPYEDDAAPTPLNVYGESKASGEQAVTSSGVRAAIVRTSLIYDTDEMDRVTAEFVERLQRGERLSLFVDSLRQPIWRRELVRALLQLAENRSTGFINISGRELVSRHELARLLFRHWAVPEQGMLDEVRVADRTTDVPLVVELSLTRCREVLGWCPAGVREVLKSREGP